MHGDVPDDKDVRDARNGIPAPLLRGVLLTVGGEQTGEDHDNIGADGHQSVGAVNASQQAKVEEQERRRDGPVNVTSEVNLTADLVGGVAVVVADLDAVQVDTLPIGHAEIGHGSGDGDHGRDVVVQTLPNGDIPRQQGEEARAHHHDHEHNP